MVLAVGLGIWLAVTRGSSPPTTTAAVNADVTGRWIVSEGSEARYRVRATFAGAKTPVAVTGRTERVTGGLRVTADERGLSVPRGAHFEVDMTSLASGDEGRDRSLHTAGLETDRYPTASFVTSRAIRLPDAALSGHRTRILVFGQLTLHGVTRAFALPVDARLADGTMQVDTELDLVMGDFGIHPPDIPGFVSVDIHGSMEVHLVLRS